MVFSRADQRARPRHTRAASRPSKHRSTTADRESRSLVLGTTVTRRRSSRPSREARDGRAPRTLGSARLVSRVCDRRSAHARTPHGGRAHSFFLPPLTATLDSSDDVFVLATCAHVGTVRRNDTRRRGGQVADHAREHSDDVFVLAPYAYVATVRGNNPPPPWRLASARAR